MDKVKELTVQTSFLLVFTGFEAISIVNCWYWLEICGFPWTYSDSNLCNSWTSFLPNKIKKCLTQWNEIVLKCDINRRSYLIAVNKESVPAYSIRKPLCSVAIFASCPQDTKLLLKPVEKRDGWFQFHLTLGLLKRRRQTTVPSKHNSSSGTD